MSMPKNEAAAAMGRLGRGIPKTITAKERRRRSDWARGLADIRRRKQDAQKREYVAILADFMPEFAAQARNCPSVQKAASRDIIKRCKSLQKQGAVLPSSAKEGAR